MWDCRLLVRVKVFFGSQFLSRFNFFPDFAIAPFTLFVSALFTFIKRKHCFKYYINISLWKEEKEAWTEQFYALIDNWETTLGKGCIRLINKYSIKTCWYIPLEKQNSNWQMNHILFSHESVEFAVFALQLLLYWQFLFSALRKPCSTGNLIFCVSKSKNDECCHTWSLRWLVSSYIPWRKACQKYVSIF